MYSIELSREVIIVTCENCHQGTLRILPEEWGGNTLVCDSCLSIFVQGSSKLEIQKSMTDTMRHSFDIAVSKKEMMERIKGYPEYTS